MKETMICLQHSGFFLEGPKNHQGTRRSPSYPPFTFHYWYFVKGHTPSPPPPPNGLQTKSKGKKKNIVKGWLNPESTPRCILHSFSPVGTTKGNSHSLPFLKPTTILRSCLWLHPSSSPSLLPGMLILAQWCWVSRGTNYSNTELLGTGMKSQLRGQCSYVDSCLGSRRWSVKGQGVQTPHQQRSRQSTASCRHRDCGGQVWSTGWQWWVGSGQVPAPGRCCSWFRARPGPDGEWLSVLGEWREISGEAEERRCL